MNVFCLGTGLQGQQTHWVSALGPVPVQAACLLLHQWAARLMLPKSSAMQQWGARDDNNYSPSSNCHACQPTAASPVLLAISVAFLHNLSPFGKPAVTLSQCCFMDHCFGNPGEKDAHSLSCMASAVLCSSLLPWQPDPFLTAPGCSQHLSLASAVLPGRLAS